MSKIYWLTEAKADRIRPFFSKSRRKTKLDEQYLAQRSLALDLKIIAKTVRVLLPRTGH